MYHQAHLFLLLLSSYLLRPSRQQPHGGTFLIVGLTYGDKPPPVPPPCPTMCPIMQNVTFEDILVTGAVVAGSISGAGERDPLHGLTFRNISFIHPPQHGWSCSYVASYTATSVTPPITCSKALDANALAA